MTLVHVAFQEGFENDAVVLRLNGAEVFRQAGLTTKNQIGYADSFETDVPPGPVRLEVDIASRGTNGSQMLHANGPTYVGVSLDRERRPTFHVSLEPFGYL